MGIELRIAVFQPRIFIRGGADRNMFEVFRRVKRKHEVKFFCGYYSPIGFAAERDLDIDGVITPITTGDRAVRGYGAQFLSGVTESIRRISRFHPDAIVVNNGYEFVDMIHRRCARPVITYVGGTDWYKSFNILNHEMLWKIPGLSQLISIVSRSDAVVTAYRRFENMAVLRTVLSLSRCNINICVSDYVSHFLKDLNPRIRTKVVYPGVDHNVFKPTFLDEDYMVNITRIQPNKNPILAAQSVKGTGHELRIYANMERGFEAYERYYRELLSANRENMRIFLDASEETIIRDLQRCSLFLSPAKNEGVPLVILEAMACGKFVIGHNTGAQSEFLNGCGITCGDNPKEWRRHINRLMSDRAERIALGKRAYAASLKYTWDKTAKEIEQTIEEYA